MTPAAAALRAVGMAAKVSALHALAPVSKAATLASEALAALLRFQPPSR